MAIGPCQIDIGDIKMVILKCGGSDEKKRY